MKKIYIFVKKAQVADKFKISRAKLAYIIDATSAPVAGEFEGTLLSQFTDNYRELLLGVNIGGTGTLIASLASLITFREYVKHNPKKMGYYVALFSAFNFAFLIILTALMLLV